MILVRIAPVLLTALVLLFPGSSLEAAKRALRFEAAFAGHSFVRPLVSLELPDDRGVFLVAEQAGKIWQIGKLGGNSKQLVADISGYVRRKHGEEGLLSVALDSRYPDTRQIFVYYSASRPRRTVLARIDLPADRLNKRVVDKPTRVLLEIPQPYGNHNGGTVLFGPDGLLYLGVGDGGSGGDPLGHGQNLSTLLGTILRLNVHPKGGGDVGVPSDNPFLGTPGARPEIWAYGLRNPWRMSFDRETGRLWVGDVGQSTVEEVNIIKRGGNYGWNLKEGRERFGRSVLKERKLEDPVLQYGRQRGQSITGGYVYRGKALPGLFGTYIFGDFASRVIWALTTDGERTSQWVRLGRSPCNIASFAEDRSAELSVVCLDGKILQIRSAFTAQ